MVISLFAPSVSLNMSNVTSLTAAEDATAHAFRSVFAPLAPHMAELDRFLHVQLASFEPEIRTMVGACIDSTGSRIRPALVFLSGWRAGDLSPDLLRVAAVVELIHLATLVHDDIRDEADVRRSRGTASREYGSTPAVLLGDALFAHGLHLATQFSTPDVCAAITASTRRVCAGEIVQTVRVRSLDVTRADYQRIVELKTAELFRVSCSLGSRLGGSEPAFVEAAGRFGRHLGTAYQLCNDLTDFFGEELPSGKTPESDPVAGRLTFPLLVLLEKLPGVEADALRAEITGERAPQLALRLRQMREHAVFPVVADAVQAELAAAAAALHEWHGHPPTARLLDLCDALTAQVAGLRSTGKL